MSSPPVSPPPVPPPVSPPPVAPLGRQRDLSGIAPPPPPPPGGFSALWSPPRPAVAEVPAGDLQEKLAGLEQRVRQGRRRSVLLGYGAVAAAALGLLCWAAYYATSVLSYARLENIQLVRVPGELDRLAFRYQPLSGGTIGFCRADGQRETELLDRIAPDQVGQPQEFHWRVNGVQPGDVIQVVSLDGWSLRTTELRVPEAVPGAETFASASPGTPVGDAVVSGRIINAIDTKKPVPEARVRIVGTYLSTRTDEAGSFRIAGAPGGVVPIEVSAKGFTTERFERNLVAGKTTSLRLPISPGMKEGQVRIVLTWGQQPKDLDAHLEGPLPEGKRFHISYQDKGDLKSQQFVSLDADAQDGEGPETITVLGVLPGTYRYYVHDYSDRNNPQSTALATSGAEVKVYQGGQSQTFRAGHNMAGNLWDVCTIEVTPQGAAVNKVDKYQQVKFESLGLYAKRTMGNREQWIGNYGGSAISEKSVNDGLEWLARHQADDGFWSCTCLGKHAESKCDPQSPCTGEGDTYEAALTGLSLLAFQAGGHYYFNGKPYSDHVRKGLDWLVEHQHEDGALVGSKTPKKRKAEFHQYYMYEHGIATFALADACAAALASRQPADERYTKALQKAVDFIYYNQHHDGGWRYDNVLRSPSDTSVTGWQVLALKSAKEAGIPIREDVIEKVRTFFKNHETGEHGRTAYQRGSVHTEATTGVGMLARQFLLNEPDAPLVRDAAKYLADFAERRLGKRTGRPAGSDQDYYLWYNCTLGMFQVGGEVWNRWNGLVRDAIIDLQRHGEDCERGSWDPDPVWGNRGGRIYSTALAILTLEVYYRYTPQSELGPTQFELNSSAQSPPDKLPTQRPPEVNSRGSDNEVEKSDAPTKKRPAVRKKPAKSRKP